MGQGRGSGGKAVGQGARPWVRGQGRGFCGVFYTHLNHLNHAALTHVVCAQQLSRTSTFGLGESLTICSPRGSPQTATTYQPQTTSAGVTSGYRAFPLCFVFSRATHAPVFALWFVFPNLTHAPLFPGHMRWSVSIALSYVQPWLQPK